MQSDNIFLIDWLSFRCESMDYDTMIRYLGLEGLNWEITHGFYGFQSRRWCSGISIHYGHSELEGVLVEMSGQGCRTFETFRQERYENGVCVNHADWGFIFDDILHDDDFSVTRLDIAFDDHEGLLPMKRLITDFRHENFVTRFKSGRNSKSCKLEMSPHDSAATIYFGSPQSEIRFRIYDKSAERGFDESVHWIRFEMQMRREIAYEFIKRFVESGYKMGDLFAAIVSNYLRFVTPSKTDSNKRRWNTARYWQKLVGDVLPVSLWVRKDLEYNKAACESYVYGMAGNSVKALIELDGIEKFVDNLEKRRSKKVSPRIRQMIHTEKMLAAENADAILEALNDEVD